MLDFPVEMVKPVFLVDQDKVVLVVLWDLWVSEANRVKWVLWAQVECQDKLDQWAPKVQWDLKVEPVHLAEMVYLELLVVKGLVDLKELVVFLAHLDHKVKEVLLARLVSQVSLVFLAVLVQSDNLVVPEWTADLVFQEPAVQWAPREIKVFQVSLVEMAKWVPQVCLAKWVVPVVVGLWVQWVLKALWVHKDSKEIKEPPG